MTARPGRLPARVRIVEVGPRDGLQNVAAPIATQDKLTLARGLVETGLDEMEATSFVHPKWIPQLADADAVMAGLADLAFSPLALVPNRRGQERALAHAACGMSYVLSATDEHSRANLNTTTHESVEAIVALNREIAGARISRASISMTFGCPFSGPVPAERVAGIVARLAEGGIGRVVLCDTIGCANPAQVHDLCRDLRAAFPGVAFELHLHDTQGFALANAYAGLEAGITSFDAAVAGLGGCPFAPGASGNVATEDLVAMFSACGVETGVDLDRLAEIAEFALDVTGGAPQSAFLRNRRRAAAGACASAPPTET